MRRLASTFLLTVGMAAVADAQGVPRVAISFEGGAGPHTSRAGETYFRSNFNGLGLWTASVRLIQYRRLAAVARYENVLHTDFVYTSDCPHAPNGTCMEHFREADGQGAALGIGALPWSRVTVSAFVGRHWDGPRTKDFVEGRVAIAPWRWVGFSAAIRHMSWHDPEHGPLWHRPTLVGAQLQLP
jgi:hypothetical protein